MTITLNEDDLALFAEKRFYVFFRDGSWRTATQEQWKLEKLYQHQGIERSFWFGGEDAVMVIKKVGKKEDDGPLKRLLDASDTLIMMKGDGET